VLASILAADTLNIHCKSTI